MADAQKQPENDAYDDQILPNICSQTNAIHADDIQYTLYLAFGQPYISIAPQSPMT